jgi:hypothetical protein
MAESDDERSLLLPGKSTFAICERSYEDECSQAHIEEEKVESIVFDFNENADCMDCNDEHLQLPKIQPQERKAVFVRSIGTDMHAFFSSEQQVILPPLQKRESSIQCSMPTDCDCGYFHPDKQRVVTSMKMFISQIVQENKDVVLKEFFGQKDDDTMTLCNEGPIVTEVDDDDKTVVNDEMDQTPYVRPTLPTLPMFLPPISTTLSMRMPAQAGEWPLDASLITATEKMEIEAAGYEWIEATP